MTLIRWLFNAAVTLVMVFLLLRALLEWVPALNALPQFVKALRTWDPLLEQGVRELGLPWSRDVRGFGLIGAAVLLNLARSLLLDLLEWMQKWYHLKRSPPAAPARALPAGDAVAPAASTSATLAPAPPASTATDAELAATVVTTGQPVQSVTGTAFLESGGQGQGVPRQIGRYRIIEVLGHGAMGTVFKAEDPKIGRMVAIKTISAVGAGPEMEHYRERFLVEAKSAGRLNHPGVVSVYDVTEDANGKPCLVLEFVPGTTLDRLVSDHQPGLAQLLDYVAQIARALDYAHAQGIVHRDVKPANIMVTKANVAKLSDFGIAKIEGTTLTVAGQVLGTPAFMSPEQCMGNAVDFRSDIFSLGTVLYTLVSGMKPFPGDSFTSVAYKVVHSEYVPLTQLDPRLPAALDAVVAASLAKDAGSRYASAGRMADELDAIRVMLPPATDP
ncbi:MAG TPA: serine/threonine-protein kinase [Verrucomicrobiae bacterium]|nr:serine/threonine-protein kinase [Verrucomicrobiae bacterium]